MIDRLASCKSRSLYTAAAILGVACLLLCGCTKPLESQVSGTVTLDGEPLRKGNIIFQPAEAGVPAYGTIDSEGKFEIKTGTGEGMNPGEYVVVVKATEEAPPPSDPNAPEVPPKVITPMKYASKETSDLRYTIAPGENEIEVPLVSR